MLESDVWAVIGALTPPGLLGLAIWLILTGRLVPKAMYDVILKSRDDWQSAAEKLRETNSVQARTIEKQEVVGDSFIKIMTSIQEVRDKDST